MFGGQSFCSDGGPNSCQLLGPPPEQRIHFWGLLLAFFGLFGPLCVQGAMFWSRDTISSPKNLSYDNLMKPEWLISNVTVIGRVLPPEQKVQFFDIVGVLADVF